MKQYPILIAAILLASSCGEGKKDAVAELAKLKTERSKIDQQIAQLEKEANIKNPQKATDVRVQSLNAAPFNAYIELQSQVVGDQNILATPQVPGVVTQIHVRPGQNVGKGTVLATLDAAAIDQQILSADVQLKLMQSLYEKQRKLFAEDIGSEVQLLQAKAGYEGAQKAKAALVAQRNMYRIIAPVSGVVDNYTLKVGDMASPGMAGIRVVNHDQLRAEANLGENFIGKVKAGDKVVLVFPDLNDSITSQLSYVSKQIDAISRSFTIQVKLNNRKDIYPNMSCQMKILSYTQNAALVVPVQLVQESNAGKFVYVMEGKKAVAKSVKVGRTSNGNAEILEGLKAGDQIIVEGYNDIDDGEAVIAK